MVDRSDWNTGKRLENVAALCIYVTYLPAVQAIISDNIEFKPTMLLSKGHRDSYAQQGKGRSRGHVQQDRDENKSGEPLLGQATVPKSPNTCVSPG